MDGDSVAPLGSPLVFVSYAHGRSNPSPAAPSDPDALVLRFFGDLTSHVTQLVSPPTGVDTSFLDRSMHGGERWETEVTAAVGTCQVFVPLISPAYPQRRWCLREWEAFARRKVNKRDPGVPVFESAIVPVVWVPTDLRALPEWMREVQWFTPERLPDPTMAVQYRENGLYGLLTTGQDNTYKNIVWKLAQRVAEICLRHWVEPAPPDPGPGQRRRRRRSHDDER